MRPWAIVALIVLVAGILGGFTACGHKAGKAAQLKIDNVVIDDRTSERDAARNDLAQCRVTLETQKTALETQNTAITKLQDEGTRLLAERNKAQRIARLQAQDYQKRAERIAGMKPGDDACFSARELALDVLKEERK